MKNGAWQGVGKPIPPSFGPAVPGILTLVPGYPVSWRQGGQDAHAQAYTNKSRHLKPGRAATPPPVRDTTGPRPARLRLSLYPHQARADQQWSLAIQHAGQGAAVIWGEGGEGRLDRAQGPGLSLLCMLHCPTSLHLHFKDESVKNLKMAAAEH